MKIITIATQKGGAGKTSSAAAIAQAASFRGLRSILIDTDAQASAGLIYGADTSKAGIYELLTGKRASVQHTSAGDIITPGRTIELFKAPNDAAGNRLLYIALQQISGLYDVCCIDTAPGLSAMLIQAIAAADSVLIPAGADSLGLSGLTQITDTIKAVKRVCKQDSPEITGVFITKRNDRATLKRQYADLLKKECAALGIPFANTGIPEAVALQEAQALRKSLFEYAPDSKPAKAYLKLIDELKLF